MMTGNYYPPQRPPPRAYYPRYRPSRQPLRVVLLVILFAGLLLTSAALIIQFIYRPPSISHTPVTIDLANSSVSVSAMVFGGGSWVQNVTLFYNIVDKAVWKTKSMTLPTSGVQPYVGVIPGNEVTSSIAYYIMATNGLGLSTNTVGYFVLVRDFNISSLLPALVLSAGTSNSTTITVGSKGGFGSSVSLSMSGLPSGVTASFNPPTVTPTPNGTVTSNMVISSTTAAPAGTYTTSLTGSSGNLTHTRTMTVKVNPPRDFDLSVTPNSVEVRRGAAAFYNLTLTAKNGYVHALTLSVSGLPTGIRYTFTTAQNKTAVGGTMQGVTLMVTTNNLSPLGTFISTVQVTDGTITHTAQITLIVRP